MENDDLYLYTRELFTLALIWDNYHDSVKEGDGDWVMDLWKFLFVIFKKAKWTNYSKEAFILLVHYHFLLSKRLADLLILTSSEGVIYLVTCIWSTSIVG